MCFAGEVFYSKKGSTMFVDCTDSSSMLSLVITSSYQHFLQSLMAEKFAASQISILALSGVNLQACKARETLSSAPKLKLPPNRTPDSADITVAGQVSKVLKLSCPVVGSCFSIQTEEKSSEMVTSIQHADAAQVITTLPTQLPLDPVDLETSLQADTVTAQSFASTSPQYSCTWDSEADYILTDSSTATSLGESPASSTASSESISLQHDCYFDLNFTDTNSAPETVSTLRLPPPLPFTHLSDCAVPEPKIFRMVEEIQPALIHSLPPTAAAKEAPVLTPTAPPFNIAVKREVTLLTSAVPVLNDTVKKEAYALTSHMPATFTKDPASTAIAQIALPSTLQRDIPAKAASIPATSSVSASTHPSKLLKEAKAWSADQPYY